MTDVSDASDERPLLRDREVGGSARRGDTRSRLRRLDKGLLVASLAIALGLVLVVRGLSVGITGDGREALPEAVEDIEPVRDAVQVLSQSRVFVDLATGYTGVLVIDGVEIETVDIQDFTTQEAGRQVELPPATIFEGGNHTLTFIPNDAAPVTEFTSGVHRVTLIYWEIEIGRQRAQSYSWTFTVV